MCPEQTEEREEDRMRTYGVTHPLRHLASVHRRACDTLENQTKEGDHIEAFTVCVTSNPTSNCCQGVPEISLLQGFFARLCDGFCWNSKLHDDQYTQEPSSIARTVQL